MRARLAGLLIVVCAAPAVIAQPTPAAFDTAGFVRTHYAKYEYRIPMRDGKKPFAAVYIPQAEAFGRAEEVPG